MTRSRSSELQVSVIMPVFNGARHLRETLDSVLNQSLQAFEFIIVDDASTDSSWEILDSFAQCDPRILLERNEQNRGHQWTSNRCLELASSKYVARQDQDDIALPNRLAAQVAFLDQNPKIGLVSSAYFRLMPEGKRLFRQPPVTDTGLRWRLLFGNVICHAAIMVRSDLSRTGELMYKDLPGPQDYDLLVRLLGHTRFATLTDPLVIYRMHEHTMTALYGERQDDAVHQISARQLRALLPDEELVNGRIQALRACSSPQLPVGESEIDAVPLLLKSLQTFEKLPLTDPREVRLIRRTWIERMIRATPNHHWSRLFRSGLIGEASRQDPLGFAASILLRLPLRAGRKVLRRFTS